MRIVVNFDLPQVTLKEKRTYRKFRKELIKYGFVMNQYSMYSKLCLNSTQQKRTEEYLTKIRPDRGVVEYFCLTEKQYARRRLLVGSNNSEYIQTTTRQVIL
ncbi:MAG: CRISPR-associated endonuclease Cas2 [Coriobacteriales bacterium]|jgi:CRISPR-associated protein Cas2|nr:CRISPR-associated endonuclease Cas2 [Coriobacteriales bacterium]